MVGGRFVLAVVVVVVVLGIAAAFVDASSCSMHFLLLVLSIARFLRFPVLLVWCGR